MILPASANDAEFLTEIALKSKAYWGYSNGLVESWRPDLTVTSTMISATKTRVFIHNKNTAGFYVLNPLIGDSIELEMLFVLPEFIGLGIGKKLLNHAFEEATKLNALNMTLLADPNAENFYKSQGFVVVDKKESSVKGRFLPVMEKKLSK